MRRHARKERPYIVFDDKNLDFTPMEVAMFEELIGKKLDVPDIAKQMKRSNLEVLLLYLDRVEKEIIEPIHKFVRII